MLVIRDHLVRHPDRCIHQAVCVPICPTSAWLSTPPLQIRSLSLFGKLPVMSGRLSLTSNLCRVQEGRQIARAAEKIGRMHV